MNRSLLSIDVRVEERSELDEVIALEGATVGKNCRLRRVIIGEDCVVPDNTVIGFDPEIDKQRFVCSDKGVVLVTRDMFE
ncbi:hypothetical protein [Aliagarivorans taiwanensis]|uniref:hypothetical protein n=1 Tax=Aliagarivorans taiwanensis TaxID=561966 RepID=UPI001FDF66BF|nr:hypothetical protein [Aliagarivorans taiwanensis]